VSSWNVLRPVLLFVDMCVLGTPAQFESAELKVSAYCVHSKSDGACSTIVLSLLRWDITRWYVLPLSADPCSIVDEVSSLDIMRQVLQALDHIHSHGVMHRDVKARIAFMLFVCGGRIVIRGQSVATMPTPTGWSAKNYVFSLLARANVWCC